LYTNLFIFIGVESPNSLFSKIQHHIVDFVQNIEFWLFIC